MILLALVLFFLFSKQSFITKARLWSKIKGLTSENRFDQLFAASMIGGPNEKFESIPPMSNRYIVCGQSPYIAIYYAIEVKYKLKPSVQFKISII